MLSTAPFWYLWERCTTVTFLAQTGHLLFLDGELQGYNSPLDCSGWVRWNADSIRTTNGDDKTTSRAEHPPDRVRCIAGERAGAGHCYLAEPARQPERPLRQLSYGTGMEAHPGGSGIRSQPDEIPAARHARRR